MGKLTIEIEIIERSTDGIIVNERIDVDEMTSKEVCETLSKAVNDVLCRCSLRTGIPKERLLSKFIRLFSELIL